MDNSQSIKFSLNALLLVQFFSGFGCLSLAIGQAPNSENIAFTAYPGEPFGVASLSIPIGPVESGRLPRIVVSDADGRIFYPAVDLEPLTGLEDGRVVGAVNPIPLLPERRIGRGGLVDRFRNVMRQTQDIVDPPRLLRIQFLFAGDAPLKVHLSGDYVSDTVVTPAISDMPIHRESMLRWWDGYVNQSRRQLDASDYPPGIETYLCEMLSSRLQLPPEDLRSKRQIARSDRNIPLSTLELLGGVDSLRDDIMRASVCQPKPPLTRGNTESLGSETNSPNSVPLPQAPRWTQPMVPELPQDLPVEKIANHVPPECFYLRFERFSNYLWFQQLTEAKGQGIAQMAMLRGINYKSDKRVQQMLNTKMTLITKLFGDALVQDVALIGLDLYLQDGPAIGVLFESSMPDILMQSLHSDRSSAAERLSDQGVTLEEIEILDTPVSFLSAPDNHIRSFLVRSGNYILLTTSKSLCTRFLEVDQGSPSLATDPSFRYARLNLPVKNDYTMFAFFSPQFFRSLISPHYTIELRRRFQAIAHLQLAEMALLIDKHESQLNENDPKSRDIASLISKQLLPPTFLDATPDSKPIYLTKRSDGQPSNGNWIDSVRGARGSFIPIPDMTLEGCTQKEADSYVEQSSYYESHWQQTDPLAFGVRRFKHPTSNSIERLAIEAYVAPFGRDKFGWMSKLLAPPVRTSIQLPADDMVNLQVHMSGQSLFGFAPVEDHVLFAGVKDMVPPPPNTSLRLIDALRTLQMSPAYLGAWPLPGYLDRLPIGFGGGPADSFGFSRLLIGAWRWQSKGFSVLSFDRSILEQSSPVFAVVPAKDPAQARATVADLENSKLSSWVNTYWYRRGLQASRGNARLLDTIQTQFQIPAAESKVVAERLIDGEVQCPLGGTYSLVANSTKETKQADELWFSSAWPTNAAVKKGTSFPAATVAGPNAAGLAMNPQTTFPPPDYSAPWLGWFRGGQIHVTQLESQLILVGQIDLEKLPPLPIPSSDEDSQKTLPNLNFDLFTLPFSGFGQEKKGAN